MTDVRLRWDPDHGPSGDKLAPRAIQLGLRGATLAAYARAWIVDIEDISAFVAEQRRVWFEGPREALVTPREAVYPAADPAVAARLGLA